MKNILVSAAVIMSMFCYIGMASAESSSLASIPCPPATSSGVVATYGPDSNNGQWHMYTYTGGASPYGTPQYIYRRYQFSGGVLDTHCYDTTPSTHVSDYVGWIVPNSWWQNNNGTLVGFTTYDGNTYSTTNMGSTWTLISCGGANGYFCGHGQGGVTCYHAANGSQLTCAAGQYCHYNGSVFGVSYGTCITPCTYMAGTSSCGCALLLSPVNGVCPTMGNEPFYLTSDNNCVMSKTNSACLN